MKKINIKIVLICLLVLTFTSGCTSKNKEFPKPEISQIKSICNLATLKTYYHNVAKLEKAKESGLSHLFQKDRELWIEYTGIATIGIDMSKVSMKLDKNNVYVNLPAAKLLSIDIDEDKIDKDSFYYSKDNALFFKNEFTAEDQTKAIKIAQKEMKEDVKSNSELLKLAQYRAKELIEKYIKQIGDDTNTSYKIKWEYE